MQRKVAALTAGMLTAALGAQRASCSGTLRVAAGAPVAGALVTCVQELSQVFGVDPDRVEAKTDDAGRYSAGLLRGSPYAVWAFRGSPAGDERAVTSVSMAA